MLIEVFGHVYLSCASIFGYMTYFLNYKFLLLSAYLSQTSDAGGYFFGNKWGKTPFAKSISPNKTMEGICGCFTVPVCVTCVFWAIS